MAGAKEQQDLGLKRKNDSSDKSTPPEFQRSLAVVIGIDRYSNGIPPLSTAVNDAQGLADILKGEEHGYEVILLTDEEATLSRLEKLFCKELPEKLGKDDRLLVYFAGHGIASPRDDGDPAGFLIPQNATLEEKTFWPMTDLHEALEKLECRHMLAILDCCFAGAFRWSSKRDFQPLPSVIHKERYERFIRSRAWQAITSAAYNQKALDILSGKVLSEQRGAQQQEQKPHSPFALSLFEALHGAADLQKDGVVTATELYLYLRNQVEVSAEQQADHQQTPGLWPLNRHEYGEFIFLLRPEDKLNLPPAPDLTEENNPYKGLSPYEKNDSELFFGRTALVKKLKRRVAKLPFTVVLGASGTGKSSLVKAGLLPALEHNANNEKRSEEVKTTSQPSSWFILERVTEKDGKTKKEVMRPGANPLNTLRRLLINDLPGVRPERKGGATPAGMIGQWRKKNPGQKLLLVIDQFEELITLCREEQAREDFIHELRQALEEHSEVLRIVLTLRSDFEAQISQNYLKDCWRQNYRFVVPPMTQNELREVIEQPASVMVLYFEPRELVDRLINEVIQTPGALPLLSFTLSELYLCYVKRQDGNRALTQKDYEEIGGVIGSLRRRIDHEYEKLDADEQATMKRILLRMIAFEGGELTRRRVPKQELKYPDAVENDRVDKVVDILSRKRLIVEGSSENTGGGTESYIEPAHDALIVAWDKLLKWRADEEEAMLLQRQLTRAAMDWEGSSGKKEKKGLLWDNNPRLVRAQEILQEKRFCSLRAEKKQGLFVWLKKFWQVLCPSFEDIEQTVWLNRVETAFVRRSVERKRNWTRGVTVFVLGIFISLLIGYDYQKGLKEETETALAESNYNLAKAFEEKAMTARRAANEQGDVEYKKTILFTSAALDILTSEQQYKLIVKSNIIDTFAYEIFNSSLPELWHFSSINNQFFSKVEFSYDGRLLASVSSTSNSKNNSTSNDYAVQIWNAETGKRLHNIWTEEIGYIEFSGDSKKLACISLNDTVRIFSTNTGKQINKFQVNSKFINIISYDDNKLIFGSRTGSIQILNANNGRIMSESHSKMIADTCSDSMTSNFGSLLNLKCSPQFHHLASFDGNLVLICDKNNAEELEGHEEYVTNIAFSPDGMRLASSSQDYTIRIWDTGTNSTLKILKNHKDTVNYIIFDQASKLLASTSDDHTVRIWNTETGNQLKVINGDAARVSFSRDNKKLATVKDTVRILDTDINKQHNIKINTLFLHDHKPTPLYHTFIKAVKFLWQLDVQGLEIVETDRRTPADIEKYGTLLVPPSPGQNKFDQVLEWTKKQQKKK